VLVCFGDGMEWESACHGSPRLPPPLGYAAVALAHMVQGLLIHFYFLYKVFYFLYKLSSRSLPERPSVSLPW